MGKAPFIGEETLARLPAQQVLDISRVVQDGLDSVRIESKQAWSRELDLRHPTMRH